MKVIVVLAAIVLVFWILMKAFVKLFPKASAKIEHDIEDYSALELRALKAEYESKLSLLTGKAEIDAIKAKIADVDAKLATKV